MQNKINKPLDSLVRNHSHKLKIIQIMYDDSRHKDGWVTCIIAGRYIQAKVYDEPSEYGINSGRVSKLAIMKDMIRDHDKAFDEQLCYSYDRGLNFSNISDEDVNVVVAALEKLPPVLEEEF